MSVSISRKGVVALVTVDNPPVNALSQAVRQGLWDAVATLDADDTVSAVVLTCAGRTFIAGADVREFGKSPVEPHLPDVISRIEDARKPWIAAIHGSALGGGLEVALGCRFRIAVPDASLGLPEVTLGIVPGSGGTVRTPRLVGVAEAVDLVTTGKPVGAAKALSMGLIDRIADGDLVPAARAFAANVLASDLPPMIRQRSVEAPDASFWDEILPSVAKRAKGAVAPLRALACLKKSAESNFEAAMAVERETFLELRASAQAAALRHVFFAERGAPKPRKLKGVEPRKIDAVGVVGGGTMGAGIAVALRDAGLPVMLIEHDDAAVGRAIANIARSLGGAVKRGRITQEQADAKLAGVTATTDYAALSAADLVIEAVFEDLGVKRAVFEKFGAVCRPDAVLATNTSYLDPNLIAEGLADPTRYIGLHFFSPANVMKLLEIVPADKTADDVLATGFALARLLKKMPVEAGICDGFIGNRILKRYRAEAEELVCEGVEIAEIDAAMRGFGFAMGPFEAQDLGGLDIAFLQREGARSGGQDIPETLGDILVKAGRKGQKTSGGWYDYGEGSRKPVPSATTADLLKARVTGRSTLSRDAIAARLVAVMADEGADILAEGIAQSAADIDLVKIHGYGFPRWRGGPMFHALQRGVEE
ncbi:3-hydroxyacyl-CoA dehydrogenase NAD-binding domain-containing protein [Roseibium sp.]|uniref:3-hydroxyacyl-CoA dehydrogenase NAD-binding domain-containing protein n=1 Tax=Roseibium sp. TaxID=1936156 RepID=UPI003A976984